jgi:chemotaxis protein methyltransferase CheR
MSQIIWSEPLIESIVQQICTQSGLFFRESQRETVEQGIRQAMQRANQPGLAEYGEHLRRNLRAFDELMIELTVGETYFFRDTGQMEFIRRDIVPELSARRGPDHPIRVWSAGCATGEEPYSLAMLFTEAGLADRVHILGTDISRRSLERAEDAHYGEWSLRGEGAKVARKYLRHDGKRYHVDPNIRSRVQFGYLNLALDMYPSNITGTRDLDLILCRNVMIYFDRETIASVAHRFHDALAPGGWIVTAAGDPSLDGHAPFETVSTNSGLFYRRAGAVPSGSLDRRTEPGQSSTVIGAATPSISSATPSPFTPLTMIPPTPVSPSAVASKAVASTAVASSEVSSTLVSSTAVSSSAVAAWRDAPPRGGIDTAAKPIRQAAPVVPPPVVPAPITEALASAQAALNAGDYARAAEIAARLPATADAAVIRVQALANSDLRQAEKVCADAAKRHSLSAHLQYLHAVLLLDLNREQEAAQAVRRAAYLDNSLAIAHFTLGSILRRLGDVEGARRSFRNARDLCAARPPQEIVCFSDGEQAGALARAAQLQLESLNR